jgi:acyl carrier protein phosphodiesterase
MNHLAHALIAARTRSSLFGSLLGDFVKGELGHQYDPATIAGVRLHRQVDAFTDAHAIVARSRRRLRPPYRRYAGILVDMYYDHFLARDWSEYEREPLAQFARRVYSLLARRRDELPANMHRFADYLVREDLFAAYRSREGIARALAGVSGKLKRANPLASGGEELERNYEGFEEDFRAFFPEVLAHAHSRVESLDQEVCR